MYNVSRHGVSRWYIWVYEYHDINCGSIPDYVIFINPVIARGGKYSDSVGVCLRQRECVRPNHAMEYSLLLVEPLRISLPSFTKSAKIRCNCRSPMLVLLLISERII